MSSRLSVCFLVAALSACTAQSQEGNGSSAASVVGGQVASDPAVVLILVSDGGPKSHICTGTLVAQDVVLTAGHCVDPAAIGFTPTESKVTNMGSVAEANKAGGFVAVRQAIAHPDYKYIKDTISPNDIGIILLASTINAEPVAFNRAPMEGLKLNGAGARVVGYGKSVDGDNKSAGTKLALNVTISNITADSFSVGDAASGAQCHGDSGGPSIADIGGTPTIIGTSWRTVSTENKCLEGNVNTRVDKYVAFIDQYVSAAPAGGSGGAGGGGRALADDGDGDGDGAN